MSSPFCKYLDALRQFPFSVCEQPQYYFRRPGRDFTRRRSLWLDRLVWLGVGLLKKTLSVELDHFFAALGTGEVSVSKSALCQARQKLLPRFYQDFFFFSVGAYYQYLPFRRWRGFRVWATDGTGFRLPDAPGLGDAFGWHGNQYDLVPSTRLLLSFDVLNEVAAVEPLFAVLFIEFKKLNTIFTNEPKVSIQGNSVKSKSPLLCYFYLLEKINTIIFARDGRIVSKINYCA